jgi:hypothetical protein
MIIREILVSNLREGARRWMLSEDRKIRSNGSDDLNLLHQTRCMTYDQLQYNSKDLQTKLNFYSWGNIHGIH